MAYIVMVSIVMDSVVMVNVVMAYVVMAYIVMAYVVMAYVRMAKIRCGLLSRPAKVQRGWALAGLGSKMPANVLVHKKIPSRAQFGLSLHLKHGMHLEGALTHLDYKRSWGWHTVSIKPIRKLVWDWSPVAPSDPWG